MKQKLLLVLTVIGLSLSARAIEVESTPGTLCKRVDDMSVTSLTVTGGMDARDFRFIADSLRQLTEIDMSGVTIAAYSNPRAPLFLAMGDYAANAIPAAAFFGSNLSNVVFPVGLKSVGVAAFAGCNQLQTINLPATVDTVSSYAFSGSGLTTVVLPESMAYMGQGAFSNCQSLTQATVPAGMVGDDAFKACEALTEVTLGVQVTSLGNGAFNGCTALSSIVLPQQSAIAMLGNEAFIRSGITAISLESLGALTSIGDWAFAQSQLAQVTIPANVNTLGKGIFFNAPELTLVNLPANVAEIPAYMLAETQGLALDSLPDGVTTIGDYAFYNNAQTARFFLPASVSYIGSYAMAGMTGLEYVTSLADEVPALGESVWAGVDQPAVKLEVSTNEVADAYAQALQWKEFHILRRYLLGDVNCDGDVNVMDITTLIDAIMENDPDPFEFYAADINQDNEINVIDITGLIDIIMNDEQSVVLRTKHNTPTTDDCVKVNPFSVKPGGETVVTASLDNSHTYTAMQFEMELPDGLQVVDNSFTIGDRAQGHALVTHSIEGTNTLRVIIYSIENDAIGEMGENLFTFRVRADEQLAADASLLTANTLFVTTSNEKYLGGETRTPVSNTTGVNDITAGNDKVYAHAGTLVVESTEGGNAQLVATNGMFTELQVVPGRNEYEVSSGIYIVRLHGKSFKVIVK
uniref:Surface antigen BspA-like protein n=1 Tax=uncultured bacterium 34R1 TaxID=581113 RepID=C0K049_9BACT|nr:surface antigen BspA-like protein [uncultured bacterium 34R1]